MNAIGLANDGIDSFLEHQAPKASAIPTTIIGSVAGHTIEEYIAVASVLDQVEDIELIEINVSCPNTSDGLEFGGSQDRLTALLNEIRPVLSNSGMVVKLSVAAGDVRPLAESAIECGADALTLINTIPGLQLMSIPKNLSFQEVLADTVAWKFIQSLLELCKRSIKMSRKMQEFQSLAQGVSCIGKMLLSLFLQERPLLVSAQHCL